MAIVLEAVNELGVGLHISFQRRNDRYSHQIAWIRGGEAVKLWASLEGEQHNRWPPSPPLQQLTIEPRPSGKSAALLIGMAGKSHWSLSVLGDPQTGCLLFEAACRIHEPLEFLGTTYEAQNVFGLTHKNVHLETVNASRIIRPPVAGGRPSLIQILPASIAPSSLPMTLGWGYRILVNE